MRLGLENCYGGSALGKIQWTPLSYCLVRASLFECGTVVIRTSPSVSFHKDSLKR